MLNPPAVSSGTGNFNNGDDDEVILDQQEARLEMHYAKLNNMQTQYDNKFKFRDIC